MSGTALLAVLFVTMASVGLLGTILAPRRRARAAGRPAPEATTPDAERPDGPPVPVTAAGNDFAAWPAPTMPAAAPPQAPVAVAAMPAPLPPPSVPPAPTVAAPAVPSAQPTPVLAGHAVARVEFPVPAIEPSAPVAPFAAVPPLVAVAAAPGSPSAVVPVAPMAAPVAPLVPTVSVAPAPAPTSAFPATAPGPVPVRAHAAPMAPAAPMPAPTAVAPAPPVAPMPAPVEHPSHAAPAAEPVHAAPVGGPAEAGQLEEHLPATRSRDLWAPPSAALAEAVAAVPKRRKEDLVPEAERDQAVLPQAELPPGYRDPITGLPLTEAMRHEIELRANDFKTFSVVVCQPVRAMTTPGGSVDLAAAVTFSSQDLQVFASVLQESLRGKDIVGRYDSQLFLLFLPRCRVDECRIVMERIRANLLLAQVQHPHWVDVTYGAAPGKVGDAVDEPLRIAYADLLQRNAGPAWFLQP